MQYLTETQQKDIFSIQLACTFLPTLLIWATAPLIQYEKRRNRRLFTGYCKVVPFWLLMNMIPIANYITYFGLPKILTLGYQISKIVPTSCAESMAVESQAGWPCWLKRLRVWTEMYLRGDYGYDRAEFREMWICTCAFMIFEVGLLVACVFLFKYWNGKRDEGEVGNGDEEKGGPVLTP